MGKVAVLQPTKTFLCKLHIHRLVPTHCHLVHGISRLSPYVIVDSLSLGPFDLKFKLSGDGSDEGSERAIDD